MLTENPPDVFPIRTGFTAETGCVSGEFDRQALAIDYIVPVNIGDGYFCGRHQIVVGVLDLEEIFLELRQLACTEEALRVGHKRRNDFPIAVFLCMNVQHEVDEGAFDSRSCTGKKWEAGTGD